MRPLRTILAPNPSPMTLDGTRTFVVGAERPAVIDPGPSSPTHLAAILEALDGAHPSAILLTHAHPDHSSLAPVLAAETGAPVMMGRGALALPIDPAAVDRWLEGGDQVATDAGPLRAIATPGHAPEHLAFLWDGSDERVLFVGDLLMGGGDTALVAPPEGDLSAYLESLGTIASLRPDALYPSHGPPFADSLAAVHRYREHREERIRQALSALGRIGRAGAEALVDRVYGAELDPRLRSAAAGSLHAVLIHLAAAERVRAHEDGTFSPSDRPEE